MDEKRGSYVIPCAVDADDRTHTRFDSRHTRADVSPSAPFAVAARDFDEGGFTPGTLVHGRYRIVGLIGRGGMGEVYRAQDLKLGQSVALKFLPRAVHTDPSKLERFLSEVRIARQISHPNVCRVYDIDEVDGRHFLSMEFVDGEDLASLLRRIGRLPADKGVEIARQLCAGLAAAHDRGVLHRDLKPANVMIDGRGHARLADFGLAAIASEARAPGEIAGTPAYMAPEQLEGGEISTKTDIYALGLVLHEIFTGKRVFDGASLLELREQHRRSGSRPSSVSSSSVELDPAIDRVISRCLESDARQRPSSALAVSAALPGGDPLAAALAAGETPSPELLAESGSVGVLKPAVAWSLFAAFLLCLVAAGLVANKVRVYRLIVAMRPPEVLAARAEDLLDSIGYGTSQSDRTFGWQVNRPLTEYVRTHDTNTDRWERVTSADAPAVQFWYRQSPQGLVPYDYSGRVSTTDPPLLTPGMMLMQFTPRGRLVSFRGVAPSNNQGAMSAATGPWDALFNAAGIDKTKLTEIEPRSIPGTFADRRQAWEGPYPQRPDWRMRVEAAALGTAPVAFEVLGPWDQSRTPAAAAATFDWFVSMRRWIQQVGISIVLLVLGAWFALVNTRAGRADMHGARIVAVVTFLALIVSWVVGSHHAGSVDVVWTRFTVAVSTALYYSAIIWLVYLGIEPYVRRRWPESLISWTRLLAGRIADPLVGRHILIGTTAGTVIVLIDAASRAVPEWFGQPPISPLSGGNALQYLAGVGAFISGLLLRFNRMLSESLALMFLLVVAHSTLRNRWLANLAIAAIFVMIAVNREAVLLTAISAIALIGIVLIVVSRFGLLAYVAAMFVVIGINDLPFALDGSAWFASRSAITGVAIALVAAWGLYAATASRPLRISETN
jgi:hypothetical protein